MYKNAITLLHRNHINIRQRYNRWTTLVLLVTLFLIPLSPTMAQKAELPELASSAGISGGFAISENMGKGAADGLKAPAAPAKNLADTVRNPLLFEPNLGQAGEEGDTRFVARALGGVLLVRPSGVILILPVSDVNGETTHQRLAIQFEGANLASEVVGKNPSPAVVNYYLGNDPSRWLTGVPTYGGLSYMDLYDGVTLNYDGSNGVVKGTYIVDPGADTNQIRWRYTGSGGIAIDGATGDLIVQLSGGQGQLVEKAPIAWQEREGQRIPVEVGYALDESGAVQFKLGAFDPSLPLEIDPVLTSSTFLGAGGNDQSSDIALTSSGGYCVSLTLASFNPPYNDAAASCFNNAGGLIATTIIGGNTWDGAFDIAIAPVPNDLIGNVYIVGTTWSTNFATTDGTVPQGSGDAFAARVFGSPFASTLIGGAQEDRGFGIALDPFSQDLYVSGGSQSTNLGTMPMGPSTSNKGGRDAFIVRLNPATLAKLHGTFLGGTNLDCEYNCPIAVGAAGEVTIAGDTESSDFPAVNALYSFTGDIANTPGWGADAFVTRLTPLGPGASIIYSTFLGGSGFEEAYGIAVDNMDRVIVVGTTSSGQIFPTPFPTTPFALQPVMGGGNLPTDDFRDGFVSRLGWNGSGLSLDYSSFLGGYHYDDAQDVVVDANDNIYITGYTAAQDFPTSRPLPGGVGSAGDRDAFVSVLSSNGASYWYSTYLGGAAEDSGMGIAVNAQCQVFVTGTTFSANFPTTPNAWDGGYNGSGDAFITSISDGCPAQIDPQVNDLTLAQGASVTEPITVTIPALPTNLEHVWLQANGATAGFVSSINPAGGFYFNNGSPHTMVFTVAFTGVVACTNVEQVLRGTLDVWLDEDGDDVGAVVVSKTVTIRVPPCLPIPCRDLTLNLNTGTTNGVPDDVGVLDQNWIVVNAPPGENTGNAQSIPTFPGWLNPVLINTNWIASNGNSWTPGVYTFQRQFNINAAMFSDYTLTFWFAADNQAAVFLNGVQIDSHTNPGAPANYNTLTGPIVVAGSPGIFINGLNTLQVQVTNNEGPMGLLFSGNLMLGCRCTTAPADMAAWWPLDDAGAPARDIINGNDGAWVGPPTPTAAGMVDRAYDFDGVNDFINVPDNSTLNFGAGGFTIDLWVRPTANPAFGYAGLVEKRGNPNSPSPGGYSLGIESFTGPIHATFEVFDNWCPNLTCVFQSTGTLPLNQWSHVTVTVDRGAANQGAFYINGVLDSTFGLAFLKGSTSNSSPLTIGTGGLTGLIARPFLGQLDEVELFRRPLTGAEVWGLVAAGQGGKCSIHVGDLDGWRTIRGGIWWPRWRASVMIEVHASDHQPLAGALVNGLWTNPGGAPVAASCTTLANGQCSVLSLWYTMFTPNTTFSVTQVTQPVGPYNRFRNHDPDGSSNGTSITIP